MITIIVLLILAAVSISMLTGDNGIIKNASQTSSANAYYSAEEQVKLAYMAVKTEIMAQTVKDGKYDPTKSADTTALAAIVAKESTGSKWAVVGTTAGEISITYTDSKIDKDSLGTVNLEKLNGTTASTQIPREEGVVHYKIKLLATQDAKLYLDVKDDTETDDTNSNTNPSTNTNTNANTNTTTNPTTDDPVAETTIAKTNSSFIGKYADINGDGTIDGIIYVDLLDSAHLSGTWSSTNSSTFSITTDVTASNVKDYVISQQAQTDSRWSSTEQKDVVKLATNQTGTKERFYVMGLDNITDGTNSTLYWYKSATKMTDYATATSKDFGTGRANTAAIKAKWNSGSGTGGYGATDTRDMWGYLPATPKAGANATASASDTMQYRWFIPSFSEWCAFACNLGITTSNYGNHGLVYYYWSSSQYSTYGAWLAYFYGGFMDYYGVENKYCVRTSATF